MKQKLFLYTEDFTKRHQYMVQVLEERWGVSIETLMEWSVFKGLDQPKINYSQKQDDNAIQIIPHGLLSQEHIEIFDFKTLENDILSFVFFMLSRYEEYVVKERDLHQRFTAKSCYLYKTNRLRKPMVDILIARLYDQILDKYPYFSIQERSFLTTFTIDIDQAFRYQHKSFKRFLGATLRDAIQLNFKTLIQRKLSYFGLRKDPWNVYDNLSQFIKKSQPIVFFLVGDYGQFNKNLPYQNKAFQKIIRRVSSWASIGLHPSYNAGVDVSKIKEEKSRLEHVSGKKIIQSRQHYIQLSLPQTYRNLLQAGMAHDYSMGFADDIGFRAGTSFPFPWYDLEREEQTALIVHPFCAMDVTLKNYQKWNLLEAKRQLDNLKKEVEKINGVFSIITHNESLSNNGEWKGWGELLLKYWD